jgi:orotate phosphoribosyltransferase
MQDRALKDAFLDFAMARGVLRFGAFTTKAGRQSPYFFNAGLFYGGAALAALGDYYARTIEASGIGFDLLFGPAYKGIPLATATAVALAGRGREVSICYNRKEAKDHGEGGSLVGAPMAGRVLIIDDVISAGTSVRESVELIRAGGGQPVAVVTALDRMERGQGTLSATEEVRQQLGLPVISIASLDDLVVRLEGRDDLRVHLPAILAYRQRYGEASAHGS